jgi:hypothetical protein
MFGARWLRAWPETYNARFLRGHVSFAGYAVADGRWCPHRCGTTMSGCARPSTVGASVMTETTAHTCTAGTSKSMRNTTTHRRRREDADSPPPPPPPQHWKAESSRGHRAVLKLFVTRSDQRGGATAGVRPALVASVRTRNREHVHGPRGRTAFRRPRPYIIDSLSRKLREDRRCPSTIASCC